MYCRLDLSRYPPLSRVWAGADEEKEELRELMAWYEKSPQFCEHFEKLWKQLVKGEVQTSIGAAVAKAVYGEKGAYSVTRLERYAACAYAHFLQYGLRLKEREVYEFIRSFGRYIICSR